MDAEAAIPIWDTLIDVGTQHGILPAGMLALDMARIEAGLLLIEVDYFSSRHALIEAQTSTPFELSLDWTVALFFSYDVVELDLERGARPEAPTETRDPPRGETVSQVMKS